MTDAGLLDNHESARTALPGAGAAWLDALRDGGARRFEDLGLPTRKVEAWKYTDLGRLARQPFAEAPAAEVDAAELPAPLVEGAPRAVFVNGRFAPRLSRLDGAGDGVTLLPLADALGEVPQLVESYLGRIAQLGKKPLVALNTAWLADGMVLVLDEGATPERPVELLFWSAGDEVRSAWHPRNLVVLDRGATATLIERHMGTTSQHFANTVTEIAIAADARLRHYKLQDEPAGASHVATTEALLSAGAGYESFALMTGAALARNQIAVELRGEGASCTLDGAYLARGSQHTDTTTLIDHAAPGCASREVYKGVLDERARGVFQGRILVRKDAQKSDGHQSNKALLLSDRAEIDAKPELEIYADDVKCSHGATAGELDEDALFYLRSRGIPLEEARGLLIDAFVDGVLAGIADATVREAFTAHAAAWRQGGRP